MYSTWMQRTNGKSTKEGRSVRNSAQSMLVAKKTGSWNSLLAPIC